MNEFENLEILDLLTIISFFMQVTQIQNSNKHMKDIENKLNYIINKLDLVDDKVLESLTERFKNTND